MLKDIKEKYNTTKHMRIEYMLVTKGATKKNFCREKKNLFYTTTVMKSFAPHCIHSKLQDIPRSHDLKEKENFNFQPCVRWKER